MYKLQYTAGINKNIEIQYDASLKIKKDSKENHDFQSWNSSLALFGFNQGSVDSRSSSETISYSKATL